MYKDYKKTSCLKTAIICLIEELLMPMACASTFWKRYAALLEFLLSFFFYSVLFVLFRPLQSTSQLLELLSPTSVVLMGCFEHLYCSWLGHKLKDHLPSGPLSIEFIRVVQPLFSSIWVIKTKVDFLSK